MKITGPMITRDFSIIARVMQITPMTKNMAQDYREADAHQVVKPAEE